MKKPVLHSVCSLFLACSMIFPYTNYIHAQEESEPMEEQNHTIQSAEDFIAYFCNVEIWPDGMNEELQESHEYAPIQEITPDNYTIILAGNEVYNTLDETMQQQINEILDSDKETYPLSWPEMVEAATLISEEMNPDQEDGQPEQSAEPEQNPEENTPAQEPVQEEFILPQNPVAEILGSEPSQPVQPAKQPVNDSNEQTAENNPQPSETPVQEAENQPAENSPAPQPSNDSEPAVPAQENEPAETSNENQGIEPLSLLEVSEENLQPASLENTEEVKEEIQETIAPVQEETSPVQLESKVEAENQDTVNNALNEQARNFIVQYLSTGSDNVFYTNANASNYRNILNSLKAWNSMDTNLRLAINQQLINLIGKPYQALLLEAQSFSLNNMSSANSSPLSSNSVITSANMNAGMYSAAAVLSLIAAAAIIKFKK